MPTTSCFFLGLASVCDAVVAYASLPELVEALAEPLQQMIGSERVALLLLDGQRLESVPVFPAARALAERLDALDPDAPLARAARSPASAAELCPADLNELGLEQALVLPLATPRRQVGVFVAANVPPHTPRDLLEEATALLALAIESVHAQRAALDTSAALARERDRLRLLLEVSAAVTRHLALGPLMEAVKASLARLGCEWVSLSLLEPGEAAIRVHALAFAGEGLVRVGEVIPLEETPAGAAIASRVPAVIERSQASGPQSELLERLVAEGLRSGCCLPLIVGERVLGTLDVAWRRDGAADAEALELLGHVANQVAPAVQNALAYAEIQTLRDRLAEEKRCLEADLGRTRGDAAILGQSAPVERAREAVRRVAPTLATVLIQGETGTGKELFARAVHELSPRREGPFVALNCAAIPSGLLESELFGHERGAFTGANARRIGRFELADGGTLFLDEVGEIPLELQPKLLRVLEDLRFERVGSARTQAVDVRVVAATNRDLEVLSREGRFRSDLFYRLNVFPLVLPPLRERPSDVGLLARHFMGQAARRLGRAVDTIPARTLAALEEHTWPGNVRELLNAVERGVILSAGRELVVPPGFGSPAPSAPAPSPQPGAEPRTFEEWERWIVRDALEASGWVVGGPEGAAARLGLRRTTLQSRMRRLGVARPD